MLLRLVVLWRLSGELMGGGMTVWGSGRVTRVRLVLDGEDGGVDDVGGGGGDYGRTCLDLGDESAGK